ncbi:uncharacterized protein BO88DRAFT_476445 [Aspergillus vadensis CBS 113365]|uniref:Aminoglycoside phosphotransferase domain-containing protein n=1 Tax=Aspergillus vadensis (strain CBS 113365 / IMI 142717 / IBT 24658) TaxID=1448311 RepID=A0A319BLX3_ASPVC|nr:hypothetical protein BO88DRAFT_476445 [Aspergillus vadensis CBS 113365]PYH72060.1 hypothetical protein BO88DRAFT_476445 [Aspergillus vadensis CBS 113365]
MAGSTFPPSPPSSNTGASRLDARARELVEKTFGITVDGVERAPILDYNANTISYEVYFLHTMWNIRDTPKQPGVARMPSGTKQVIIQFKIPEQNMDKTRWAENKVAAMYTARTILYNTVFLRTVPEVYAWSDGSDDEHNKAWIIHSSHPPGDAPLSQSFYQMSSEHQGEILGQIATLHKLFQDYDHMAISQGYGGFAFSEEGYVRSGEALMNGVGGPFRNLGSYLTELLRRDLRRAERQPDIDGWRRSPELRRKLEAFVEQSVTDVVAEIPEYRPTFTLNRIELGNFLVSERPDQTPIISYILNWNYASLGHPLEEFIYSYNSLHGALLFPMDKDSRVMSQCILEGFPDGDVDVDLRDLDNYAYYNDGMGAQCHYNIAKNLYEALHMAEVDRPQDMEGAETLVAFFGFCAAVGGRGLYRDDPAADANPDEVYKGKAKLVKQYLKLFGYW